MLSPETGSPNLGYRDLSRRQRPPPGQEEFFIAIGDPVHNLLRQITRYTPLRLCWDGGAEPRVRYEVNARILPDDYFSLAMLHGLGGMSLELLPMVKWRVPEDDPPGLEERQP